MLQRFTSLLFAGSLFLLLPVNAFALNADDFMPPAQLNTPEEKQAVEQIQHPNAVTTEEGIDGKQAIAAASAQDAVNAAVQRIDAGGGCEQIKFPSGFGWVSTGVGIYGVMSNPTAMLTTQRQAYQVAFLNAKKNLATSLNGLSTRGQEELSQEFKTVISDTDTLANVSDNLTESIEEQVQGLLRGYVVYKVDDQQESDHGTVSVTIVATPKTMGKGQRVDPSSLTADTINDGLNAVLAELSTGLMPPVGGKVISVPQTGELAFVGFGSAVLVDNPNPAVKAKLALNSQKIAAMRARSALCGIILGDDVRSISKLDASTQTLSKQFDEIDQQDTTNKKDAKAIAKLDQQRNNFVSTQFSSEQISSMRSGVLPPGVAVKNYFNKEKTLAEAVAVYLPSATAQAQSAGQDMKNAQILQPTDGSHSGEGKMPQRGASGQVMNDADL